MSMIIHFLIHSLLDDNDSFQKNMSRKEEEKKSWSAVWKDLKSQGWTYRRGTHLVDYYYLKPSCNKINDGVEGQDFFTSEEDVQKHIESGGTK